MFYCMLCNWILSQWENMPDLPCLQALLWLHNHTAFLRYLLTSSRNYDSCTCMLKRCEEKVAIIFSQSPVNDFNSLCMPEKTMTDSRMNRKKRWTKPRASQITYVMYLRWMIPRTLLHPAGAAGVGRTMHARMGAPPPRYA